MEKMFGYCRVSSKDQKIDRQIQALTDYGVDERDVFIDKESGKNYERDSWQALVHILREGDTLVVKSLDRMGRNYKENLEQWKYITEELKANIVVLDMPILDTRNNKDLTGKLISDIVIQLLSYVAETERKYIRSRQEEGIKLAREKGIYSGRPKMEIDMDKFMVCYKEWRAGKRTAVSCMREMNLKPNTFYNRVQIIENRVIPRKKS